MFQEQKTKWEQLVRTWGENLNRAQAAVEEARGNLMRAQGGLMAIQEVEASLPKAEECLGQPEPA